jgi:hypothetical protein
MLTCALLVHAAHKTLENTGKAALPVSGFGYRLDSITASIEGQFACS